MPVSTSRMSGIRSVMAIDASGFAPTLRPPEATATKVRPTRMPMTRPPTFETSRPERTASDDTAAAGMYPPDVGAGRPDRRSGRPDLLRPPVQARSADRAAVHLHRYGPAAKEPHADARRRRQEHRFARDGRAGGRGA